MLIINEDKPLFSCVLCGLEIPSTPPKGTLSNCCVSRLIKLFRELNYQGVEHLLCGESESWPEFSLRIKVYICELYYVKQLPYEVRRSSPHTFYILWVYSENLCFSMCLVQFVSLLYHSCILIGCGCKPYYKEYTV